MASRKRRRRSGRPVEQGQPREPRAVSGRRASGSAGSVWPDSLAARIGLTVLGLVGIAVVVLAADLVFGAMSASPASSPAATPTPPAAVSTQAAQRTNITPDQLAQMLESEDFTLLNVKTPYIGEIEGTDLWIPYDQLAARASELPADKSMKIVVYCRTGTSSAIAAQTLLDLGYTDVWNLDGGMNAWTASGRTLVDKNR
jgi:rhodanese-related sulfurtransferase